MEGLIPTSDDGKSDVPREHLLKIIIMAIMWSLGAILELADRKKVSHGVANRLILNYQITKIKYKFSSAVDVMHTPSTYVCVCVWISYA